MTPSSDSWRGIAAFVLAVGVVATLMTLAIGTVINASSLSELEANILSAVLGAAVGAVATYLGSLKQHDQG